METEHIIHVEPGSEFDTLLLGAGDRPIVLIWHDRRFRIVQDSKDLMSNYDVERTLKGLRESRGAFSPEFDVEAFKEELREQRAQDSKGRPEN